MEDIHLFFGHQNRTKGYIIEPFFNFIKELSEETSYKKPPRFSNGSILELKIVKQGDQFQITMSLPCTGDYSGNKKSEYWVGSDFTEQNPSFTPVIFKKITSTLTGEQLNKMFKINPSIVPSNRSIICYFVRHGYSTHNVSGVKRFFAPSLSQSVFNTNTGLQRGKEDRTELLLAAAQGSRFEGGGEEFVQGIASINYDNLKDSEEEEEESGDLQIGKKIGTEQALQSGIKFSQILQGRRLNSICVSDLRRTHETAQYFLTGLTNFSPNALENIKTIFVLPCFHELPNKGKDGDVKVVNTLSRAFTLGQTQGAFNRENNTNCRDSVDFAKTRYSGKTRMDCGSIVVNGIPIPLDWIFYKQSYYGKYRDQFESEFSRRPNPCINNNFLGMFLNNFYSKAQNAGKKKKTSKNRKSDKNRKTSKKKKNFYKKTRKV